MIGSAGFLTHPTTVCFLLSADAMETGPPRGSLEEFEDDFDPDLDVSRSTDKVWLVKLPKWLLEHWSKVDQDDVELASVIIPYVDHFPLAAECLRLTAQQ